MSRPHGGMIDLMKVVDWSIDENDRLKYILDFMESFGYISLGGGKDRWAFLAPHRRYVLKFPRHEYGLGANAREARFWKANFNKPDSNGICYAPCRLIWQVVLMMQTVIEVGGNTTSCGKAQHILSCPRESKPDWAGYVDCHQVGKLPNGRWVAYDYAG